MTAIRQSRSQNRQLARATRQARSSGVTTDAAIGTGTYVENSALDAFVADPRAFGRGPFVVSEYSLGEKTRLPWDDFVAFLGAVHSRVLYLRAPPITQLITGNLDPRWNGPIDLVPIDVETVRNGRASAYWRLEKTCDELERHFAARYAALRPHLADWITTVDGGNPRKLLDPRRIDSRRAIVVAATLDSLGRAARPGPNDTDAERLRFTLKAWEIAMVLVRLDRQRESRRDLRNDPLDAVHYALASTFCAALVTRDKGIRRIRELMPEPRCPLFWVGQTPANIPVLHAR